MSTGKKRPQLNLDELRLLKWWLAGVLSLVAVWSISYLDVDAWGLLWLVTIAVGVVLIWPQVPSRYPAWVHKAVFPFIVAYFAYDMYTNAQPVPSMVRLDVLLLLYRAITYRKRRDDLQLVILGLFLTIIAGVLTVSLAFAPQIVAFTVCAMALLMVVNLISAAETDSALLETANSSEAPKWTQIGARRLWSRMRATGDWRLIAFGGILFAAVVGVTVLFFLAIPRFQVSNSLFLDRLLKPKSHVGFTDTLRFTDVTEIQQDDSVAMGVEIPDRTQLTESPYWRMVVLDEYRDSAFRISPTLMAAAFRSPVTSSEVLGSEAISKSMSNYWTIYLEPGVSRYLPLPGPFWRVAFTEQQWYQASRSLRVVMLERESISMKAYRVYGINLTDRLRDSSVKNHSRDPLFDRRRFQTAMPSMLDVKVSKEDREVLERIDDTITKHEKLSAEEFARAASLWLRANHRYSLKINIPAGAGDTLIRWVNSKQPGNCELFAGAFTLLARTAGYPARVIAGFHGGVWNEDYLMVSNSAAHAWCEIFDGQDSWVRVDPTPGGGLVDTNENAAKRTSPFASIREADSSWSSRVDRLRVFWYRRIVNFERRDQLDLMRVFHEMTESSQRGIRDTFAKVTARFAAWMARPWDWARTVAIFAFFASGLALVWSWRTLRFSQWKFWQKRSRRNVDPIRAEAGRWLGQLRSAGSRDEVCGELECLRYGRTESWPNPPKQVFRRARQAWRTQVQR